MVAMKEQQYLKIRNVLKEQFRKKRNSSSNDPKQYLGVRNVLKEDIRTKTNPSSKDSKAKIVCDKKQMIRESRDYAFLFPDYEPVFPVVTAVVPKKATEVPCTGPVTKANFKLVASNLPKSLPVKKPDEKYKTQIPKLKKNAVQESKLIRKPVKVVLKSKTLGVKQTNSSALQLKERAASREVCPDQEAEKAMSMIRKMFNTKRFMGRDDSDSVEESNFKDIEKEDRRSTKLARKEDQEQLRLIQEEERLERSRKKQKKV